MPDRYECQPDDWSYTHDDYDFDPDLHGEQWASQARSGRERCAKCGDECQWVTITNASVRKVTSSEFEIRLAFAMCLLLWQLDSWTETCFWVIEILAR